MSLIGSSQDSSYSFVFVVNETVVNDQLSTCGPKLRINMYENYTVIMKRNKARVYNNGHFNIIILSLLYYQMHDAIMLIRTAFAIML